MPAPPDCHPLFRRLWEHCAAKPEAVEDHPWDETVFKVRGKVFAFLGMPDRCSVTVKPLPDDLAGVTALPFVQVAPYIGRYGWVKVDVEDEAALDLAMDLIDTTYQGIAARKKGR